MLAPRTPRQSGLVGFSFAAGDPVGTTIGSDMVIAVMLFIRSRWVFYRSDNCYMT
ncbi:MAG: hypothetical protein JWL86_297 [Rhizobium sp.]|nr:hypothetical protein [Rhizobium sp.]